MSLNTDTIKIQKQLATYCRDGKLKPIEGARKDRLHNYRRLVFNIINDALGQAYPITRKVLDPGEWNGLVNDFFTGHNAQSNQIWQMPYELYEFAKKKDYHLKLNRPYLLDLLYFEWVEIEVYCMPDGEHPSFTRKGNISRDALVVNPDFLLVHLTYPVHKKPWNELEEFKGNYFVLAFRHLDSGKVLFIEMSHFFAIFFEILSTQPVTVNQAFEIAASEIDLEDTTGLYQHGAKFIEALVEQGAILGFRC